jgi:PIN domain
MNAFPKTVAVLDACVLFPAPIRDLLLHIAALDGFQPKWSAIIQEEWKRNLLIKRPDLQEPQLARTIQEMNRAFPDANVSDFEAIQLSKPLPDPGDEHVMAAAIKCSAMFIVTFNLKDFPKLALKPHALIARHPDKFVLDLIDHEPEIVLSGFKNQVAFLKKPPKSHEQVLQVLLNCGLTKTVEWLTMAIGEEK